MCGWSGLLYFLACGIFEDAGFAGRLKGVPEGEGGVDVAWLEKEMEAEDGKTFNCKASANFPSPNTYLEVWSFLGGMLSRYPTGKFFVEMEAFSSPKELTYSLCISTFSLIFFLGGGGRGKGEGEGALTSCQRIGPKHLLTCVHSLANHQTPSEKFTATLSTAFRRDQTRRAKS